MTVVALGSEILVNAIHTGNQYRPAITSLATGGFVIAWQDESGLGSADFSDDVRFARFDAFGNRLGPGTDTLVNTVNLSAQFEPVIAAFGDGRYVIAWTDASEAAPDFNNRAVRMQIFNANGSASGSEIVVNTTFTLSQDTPSIAVLTGGNIVVTWTSENIADSSHTDIIRRVFNANGAAITGEQLVNTQTVGDQDHSAVHALSTGGFAVVWEDRENVAPVGFVEYRTFIRFYGATGTAAGAPLLLNSSNATDPQQPGFCELSNGNIVVTWTEADPTQPPGDGSGHSLRARIYSPGLGTFGSVINVNKTVSNDQNDAQIAALDNGQFVVVWADHNTSGNDTSFGAVRLQVFNALGAKVGAEVRVNENTLFEQANPVVTVLKDYRFVVAWEDRSQTAGDTDGYAIHSRIFDARIAGIDLNGTSGIDEFLGSSFADTLSGLSGADRLLGGNGLDLLIGGLGLDFLDGGNDNDTLQGDAGADTLIGGAGNDLLIGGDGADSLNGGAGTRDRAQYSDATTGVRADLSAPATNTGFAAGDTYAGIEDLSGSAHDDTLLGNSGGNMILGAAGNDLIFGRLGDDSLNGGTGNDRMLGGGGNDLYVVDAAGDRVFETTTTASTVDAGGNDVIQSSVTQNLDAYAGVRFVERLLLTGTGNVNGTGNALANTLVGNSGNNLLNGGLGNDTLTGGAGNDSFVFNTALGTTNRDVITDFVVVNDTIRLENAVFTGLVPGTLAAAQFAANAAGVATDILDRIIYETDTGRLFFDANGSDPGGAVLFATLTTKPVLTHADFIVF